VQGYHAMDIDETSSRYLTLSREGVLNVWGMDWVLQVTFSLCPFSLLYA